MEKQLLVDVTMPSTKKFIFEGKNDVTKPLIGEGVIQRADSENQNKRKYPKHLLKREIDKFINTKIKENRALCELDHPDSSVISLKHACATVNNIWWKGNDVYGKTYILSDIYDSNGRIVKRGTTNGNILRAYFEHDVTVGISSRGLGSVKDLSEGVVEVQDDFEIICWDFVSEPSTQGAFIYQVNESVKYETSILHDFENNYKKINDIVDCLLGEVRVKCDFDKCVIY